MDNGVVVNDYPLYIVNYPLTSFHELYQPHFYDKMADNAAKKSAKVVIILRGGIF
jgi:hypothetical protein